MVEKKMFYFWNFIGGKTFFFFELQITLRPHKIWRIKSLFFLITIANMAWLAWNWSLKKYYWWNLPLWSGSHPTPLEMKKIRNDLHTMKQIWYDASYWGGKSRYFEGPKTGQIFVCKILMSAKRIYKIWGIGTEAFVPGCWFPDFMGAKLSSSSYSCQVELS